MLTGYQREAALWLDQAAGDTERLALIRPLVALRDVILTLSRAGWLDAAPRGAAEAVWRACRQLSRAAGAGDGETSAALMRRIFFLLLAEDPGAAGGERRSCCRWAAYVRATRQYRQALAWAWRDCSPQTRREEEEAYDGQLRETETEFTRRLVFYRAAIRAERARREKTYLREMEARARRLPTGAQLRRALEENRARGEAWENEMNFIFGADNSPDEGVYPHVESQRERSGEHVVYG